MRNRQSFYTTFLMSFLMIFWQTILLKLIGGQEGSHQPDSFGLMILQIVMAIKCISSSVIIMPSAPNLKQIIAGYIAADMLIAFPLLLSNHLFLLPSGIVISQVVLTIIYFTSDRRLFRRTRTIQQWETSGALVFRVSNLQV
ncbi:hypothetical protein [Mucilaginibacter terrenus]|nr:hypothetical protein [Mucilaginibacter terrenus]